MKSAFLWLICALAMLIISGAIGDSIYYPHPADFSFRILSTYAATGIMLITACVCLSKKP